MTGLDVSDPAAGRLGGSRAVVMSDEEDVSEAATRGGDDDDDDDDTAVVFPPFCLVAVGEKAGDGVVLVVVFDVDDVWLNFATYCCTEDC